MSSTNLTDGKSRVCFFMISGRNYLKNGGVKSIWKNKRK